MHERPFHHLPVLLSDVVELLAPRPGARFLDGTLGGGGHAEALLDLGVQLDGADRDAAALAACAERLSRFGDAVRLHRSAFADLSAQFSGPCFDGILLDLGVSSPQLDQGDRGFSFMHDGPLLMVQDDRDTPLAERLDTVSEDALTDIIGRFGEEPHARRVAKLILKGRPWAGTRALAEAVASQAAPTKGSHRATRTFQALRIWVNDELGQLDRALSTLPGLLKPGGRFGVISFHSLEDRATKQRFGALAGIGAQTDLFGHPVIPPAFRLVERKPRRGEDRDPNPRARSARLRVLERVEAA